MVADGKATQSMLEKEARAILDTMGHALSVHVARFMAYTVHKAVKRIYSELLIHESDLKMVCHYGSVV